MKLSFLFISSLVLLFLVSGSLSEKPIKPVDCTTVRCAMPTCPAYQVPVKPENSCCYICSGKPCENIMCPAVVKPCRENEQPTGCCPCTPEATLDPCADIMCPAVVKPCRENEQPTGCCPCTPSADPCADILCPAVVRYCKADELPTGCCPCTPREIGCAGVMCTMEIRYCEEGENPDYSCCPCTPNPNI
ncbi:hypothetical protein DICPUDRAFT_91378 [Dictyostelium purpureum]|uniref:Antistasin-like domain-containing protein n=1 Tax=Dictyostelium purpureum TaxID=5786 RepID=F0ZBE6_DICPU|nr:uncharacterized protein DICPUDRAFT_91378 [Dictyostelium purpureum]EGC38733.1 hypothetical protein DICPUDRAFT_91378 [Dictyostelium purpureum]|eukprot:XP_003284724.1 hypothetical protein DICPUDRAFT_91378 [Dictyostelium purpureum]